MLHSHDTREGEKGLTFHGELPLGVAIFFPSSLELVSLVVLQGDMYEET